MNLLLMHALAACDSSKHGMGGMGLTKEDLPGLGGMGLTEEDLRGASFNMADVDPSEIPDQRGSPVPEPAARTRYCIVTGTNPKENQLIKLRKDSCKMPLLTELSNEFCRKWPGAHYREEVQECRTVRGRQGKESCIVHHASKVQKCPPQSER